MDAIPHPTGYARLTCAQARAVLAVLLAGTVLCALIAPSKPGPSAAPVEAGHRDLELYRAETNRVRAGEGYYQAAAAELSARGYPTLSVFNWRTPMVAWLLAALPGDVYGDWLLRLLAIAGVLFSCHALERDEVCGLGKGLALAALGAGPWLACTLSGMSVLHDSWAAVFVTLSMAAYAAGRIGFAVPAGLAAIFVRELALPYCVLAAGLAWWQGRRRELIAWLAGLAAWGAFFAWHWWQVRGAIPLGAHAHQDGWLQFGGATFVLSTLRINVYLFFLPGWVTGLYFAAAMLGLAGWRTPWGQRVGLTVCLYVAAFGVAGQEFNHYWGILVGPLYCLGLVRFPASVRDLMRAARGRERQHRAGLAVMG